MNQEIPATPGVSGVQPLVPRAGNRWLFPLLRVAVVLLRLIVRENLPLLMLLLAGYRFIILSTAYIIPTSRRRSCRQSASRSR